MNIRLTISLACLPLFVASCGSDEPWDDPVRYHTSLTQYQSCEALEDDLKDMLLAELDTRFDQTEYWDRFGGMEDGTNSPAPGAEGDESGGREEGEDYSGTNNQEEGVDEADFVKTDGYHVYVLNGNRLHIFGVPEFGDLVPESVTEIEGQPRQMLVNRDAEKVVVFSNIWPDNLPEGHPLREKLLKETDSGYVWRVGTVSKITVFDISDRTAPVLDKEVFLEGWYQTARMVEGTVRVASYAWMYVPGLYDWYWYYWDDNISKREAKLRARATIQSLDLSDLIPLVYERTPDGQMYTHSLSDDACSTFYRPENSHGRGTTSLFTLDLFSPGFKHETDNIITNYPTLYASKDYLFLAEPANDWWWFWWNDDWDDQLNIHMFDGTKDGKTKYLGSGRVKGVLHNQFSMSEYNGYLRVATTENRWNRWWEEDPPEADNHVYVLDLAGNHELVTVGHVHGIAPGESIFSARMVGDEGFMVTYQSVDPLFTLDLSDPYNPRVVGELEIPGFSTYIHPIADDKLLTIGVGGDENGANWRTQISMFDVGDFENPSLYDTEELVTEGNWGWSEAMYEHKAFQYWAPKKLLAVPLSSYDYDGYDYSYLSLLQLVTVDTDTGLAKYGTIDHSHLFNSDPEQYWYYRDVRRSIFMGDYIYAISDRGISVHEVDDLSSVVEEPLPGYSPDDWYWWW